MAPSTSWSKVSPPSGGAASTWAQAAVSAATVEAIRASQRCWVCASRCAASASTRATASAATASPSACPAAHPSVRACSRSRCSSSA
ncbi:hypothetical protein ACFQX8_28065 [Klenkia terrae]|uniref:hypothetical protein n=1 Tax=Klenkia terrae TaxID=1052259 RepID=UPI00360D4610